MVHVHLGEGGVRARTASAAANGELHEENVHHTCTEHNEMQPKWCFTAIFQEQNRDSHEPRFIMFVSLCVLSKYGASRKIPNFGKAEINSRG